MNKSIRIFLIALFALVAAHPAGAASPKKYFEDLSTNLIFDYTYISPSMLKAMGTRTLSSDATGISTLQACDVTSIESVSTINGGNDEKLWNAIRKIKSDKDLETLSTRKEGITRYDILAKLSGNSQFVTNILVIQQSGGDMVEVVYIEGKIPISKLQYSSGL